jgi:protoporphyrinogen oxidase
MNLIIGAGISGLSAGHFLKGDCLILEKSDVPGGLSGQYLVNGFAFDYGGHYFHFQNKTAAQEHVEAFHLFRVFRRNSKIYLLDRFIPYSLQYHLAYLPQRARQTILREILCSKEMRAENLEDFLRIHFGDYLTGLFFQPFLSKFYGRPLRGMLPGMDKGSIPVPRREDVRRGATGKKRFAEGYNPVFYYPHQGMQAFFQSYSRPLLERIRFGERVLRIDRQQKKVVTDKGHYAYDNLINTMPLREFLSLLNPQAPFPWQPLQHISTLVVNAVLSRRRRQFHWLYLPEAELPFYRVGYYPRRDETAVYLEKTIAAGKGIDRRRTCLEMTNTLRRTGMIETRREVLFHDIKKIPVSYIVFDKQWPQLVPPALEFLQRQRIFSIGRYGRWDYTSMADDILTARATAALIRS